MYKINELIKEIIKESFITKTEISGFKRTKLSLSNFSEISKAALIIDLNYNLSLSFDNDYLRSLIKDLIIILEDNKSNEFERFKTNIANDLNNTLIKLSNKVAEYLNIRTSLDDQKPLREVLNILSDLSKNSCLVGGAIRDIILDNEVHDFDFATDVEYSVLKQEFLDNGFKVKETGKHFLVLNVSKENSNFEIANFRKDSSIGDGRRPKTVSPGTIVDDCFRRDFTINALYYKLNNNKLLDPTAKGINDLLNKTIRFVDKPIDRIKEDYLRGWRFIRFIKKGYIPNPKCYSAVRANWNDICTYSNPQRILQELDKI